MAPRAIQLLQKLEKISQKGQTKTNMSEEEIEKFETFPVTIHIHAEHTEEANMRTVKENFAKITKNFEDSQRLIPSVPLLEDFNKALSLDTTICDVERNIGLIFHQKTKESFTKLDTLNTPITLLLEDFQNGKLSLQETSKKLISLTGDAILVPDGNNEIGANVKENLCTRFNTRLTSLLKNKTEDLEYKTQIIVDECRLIIEEGVDDFLLMEHNDTKKQWDLLNNRRGKMGENLVAKMLYDLLVQHKTPGIVSSGIKAHSHLSECLSKFGIKLTTTNGPTSEVKHGIMMLTEENESINISFIQVKIPEIKPWMNREDTQRPSILEKHTTAAAQQLQEDIETCLEILPDISSEDFTNYIKVKYYVAFPEESVEDWQNGDEVNHLILFKEDFLSLEKLGKKVHLEPPSVQSKDLHDVYLKIGSRYFGMTSYVELKTAMEEYEVLEREIETVPEANRVSVKSIQLEERQSDIFRSGIGLMSGYVAAGPYGGGKTTLLQLEGRRIVENAKENKTHTSLIFCVWQTGATNLFKVYKNYIKTLPPCDNLEVRLTTKHEFLDEMGVKHDGGRTTDEINTLCKIINTYDKRDVYLLIDLVWVMWETPKQCRQQNSNPNDVIGYVPFIKDNIVYPWSNLDPGNVHLIVSAMSDSQSLMDKHLITDAPPEQGKVLTYILPQSFHSTCSLHHFLMYIERQVESYVRETGGWKYILHPDMEGDGHDIKGVEPEWICIKKSSHIICNLFSCNDCLIKMIEPVLKANLKELEANHKIPANDVAIIIHGTASDEEKEDARTHLKDRFPKVIIKMDDEFEGTEIPVVFSVSNGSPSNHPEMIPFSLSRATNRLYLYSEDSKDILSLAVEKGLLKKRDDLTEYIKPKIKNNPNLEVSQSSKKQIEEVEQPSRWNKIMQRFLPRNWARRSQRTDNMIGQAEEKKILKR